MAALGDPAAGEEQTRVASEQMHAAGSTIFRPYHFALRADMCRLSGDFRGALACADEGLATAGATGERWCEAELRRQRGLALAALDASDPAAVAELEQAVTVADAQGALAFLRRAQEDLEALSS
jgi:predicted ATPase